MYLPKTLSVLRKFSRDPLTGPDFVELCNHNHIELILSSEVDRGFYYHIDGKHTIVLSTRLKPRERSLVGWHEFAHFLQNFYRRETVAAFSGVEPDAASEKLADVFAMIATRPDRIRITRGLDFIDMIMRGEK